MGSEKMKKALIMLGCPESPLQIPMAVYTCHKLKEKGFRVTITSNPAAMRLIEVSDPEGIYTDDKVDLDTCINELKEADYDFLIGFVPNDAAAAYFITLLSILETDALAVVFDRDSENLDKLVEELMESSKADIVAARAYHNPAPLRVKVDRYLEGI